MTRGKRLAFVAAVFTASASAAAQQPGGDAESAAKDVLGRARAAYAALRTYQDTAAIVYRAVPEDPDGDEMRQEAEFALKFSAPGLIALTSEYGEVYSDGASVWVISPHGQEYIKSPASGRLDLEEIGQDYPQLQLLGHAAANFITRGDRNPELLTRRLKRVTGAVAEERAGAAGHRVSGIAEDPAYGDREVPMTLWINDRTGLVEEVTTDMTRAYAEMLDEMGAFAGEEEEDADDMAFKPPRYKSVTISIALKDIRVNEEIPAEVFVYKPEAGFKEVEEFAGPWAGGGEGSQEALVGKPAPDFGDTALDGTPLKLSNLKGRVVMLDFWATWCGPCVQAIPQVQELSDRFRDKAVTVIGVNQDRGNEPLVKKFIEKKKITFPQFMDEGEVGRAYEVSAIPCTVLIDKEGVVQKVTIGGGREDEVAEDIEALLAGKSLHDPAEVAARAAEPDANADEEGVDAAGGAGAALEALNENALTAGKTTPGVFLNEYQSRRVDLDGDGRTELVCADPQSGGLSVVSGDGLEVRKIRLKGKRGAFPSAFEPVRIGGEIHWLVARQSASMTGLGAPTLALHRPDGSEAWSYTVEVPEKHTAQVMTAAGDLDGDGAPEFVAVVNSFRMDQMRQMNFSPRNQASYLVILDAQGRARVQRKVGQMGSLVHIAPPGAGAAPDAPPRPTILVSCDGKLLRFTADLSGAPAAEKPAP